MRDAVGGLIGTYDMTGRYLDQSAINDLKSYFTQGEARVKVAAMINGNAVDIVTNASLRLFDVVPELLRPGGYAYTTRRYSACLRDMDYYLRYSSYAIVAGNNEVLDERVLQGLRETYNSLNVPIAPTVRGIQFMKEAVLEMAAEAGISDMSFIESPFDHICRDFSEVSI